MSDQETNETPEVAEVVEAVEETVVETPVEPAEPAKKFGIENTIEVGAALEACFNRIMEIGADKKLSIADLNSIVAFVTMDVPKVIKAIEGIDLIDDELKELDQEESVALAVEYIGLIKRVYDKFKK